MSDSKCQTCNSDLVWEGSMLDGGLSCPMGCEPYEEPSYTNAPTLSPELQAQIVKSIQDSNEMLKAPTPAAFEAVHDMGNGYTICTCLGCGASYPIFKTGMDQEIACIRCPNKGPIRKLPLGPQP